MVPKDLPSGIFPFDCRATERLPVHRVRPGEYHFPTSAQRLLGEGIDVIGCEAFGLERFHQDKSLLGSTDQGRSRSRSSGSLSARAGAMETRCS